MADIALLKKVAIFKNLDDEEIALVAEVCQEERYVSGEFIFREGEVGNRLWACVRLLSSRLRSTNDSLRSFLAMSMF